MRRVYWVLIACAWCVFGAAEVRCQPAPGALPPEEREIPFVFKADTIEYDRTNAIVSLRGAVEITHGNRVLLADRVTYFQRPDVLTAEGNVTLIDESRTVIFADRVELSGDFRDGIVENIRMRLADDSRLAAAGARRAGGFFTVMRKAVYSPCDLCKEDPERAPLWQLKAAKVTHDQIDRDIEYTDAWLEFFGVPVAYLPYLSQPDPTVERRTGLLAPRYGSDSELGIVVGAPFYIAFGPNQDATVTPIYTSDAGPVLAGEYRHLFPTARLETDASITHGPVEDGDEDYRGHFFGDFGWDINDTWRSKVNIAVTSDDTYLRRYDFDSRTTLVNRALVEGFWQRSYAAATGYGFQGLRVEDDQGQTPIVLPMFDFNYVSDPGALGGFWTADANMMALTRTEGTDSRRLSFKGGWQLPFQSRIGEVYRLFASVQADGYSVDDHSFVEDGTTREFTGLTGRFFPQAGLDWRFPFVRLAEESSQFIEPVAGVIVAPNVSDQEKIPNEDSLDIELDDTNIFAPNRFTGLDRVEGGQRVYYGLNVGNYGNSGSVTSFFLGQSFRFRENEAFPEGSGLNDRLSDIVGRVRVAPVSWIDLLYRFRLDTKFAPQRHEIISQLGTQRLFLNTQYVFIREPEEASEFGDRQEINLEAGARLTENWSIRGRTIRDLSDDGGTLFNGISLLYADECFIFSVSYAQQFYEDRDVRPSNSIFFRIGLKTLGEFGGGP